MKKFALFVLAGALSAGAFAMGAKDKESVAVEGLCNKKVEASKVETKVDIDFDKIISSGLKAAKKALDGAVEIYDKSDKKEVEGSLDFKVRDKGAPKDSADTDFTMPFNFTIPKLDDNFDAEKYFGDIADEIPPADQLFKTDTKYGISDEKLEAEYKACAAEALADAQAKAAEKLGTTKIKMISLVQDGGVKSHAVGEVGSIEIDVRLKAEFLKE
ncbi:MAG: hypothetical protein LBH41_00610 [Rickettsiales bacterium]|jgi:hypothetical protein|nr:hypothetical protein [Rickettsiales bacterium]